MYDLSSSKSLLEYLYENREDEILQLQKKDKKKLQLLMSERKKTDEQLEMAINNIPDMFVEVIKNLKSKIENKLDVEHNIDNYFTEKAYQTGFADAINLIMNCNKFYEDTYKNKEY